MTDPASRYSPWGREPLVQGMAPGVDLRPGVVLRLPETVYSILLLAAAHDGVSPATLVERLVCDRCEAIGLSALVDVLPASGASRLPPDGAGETSPDVRSDAGEDARSLTPRHGNSRDHSCRGDDHG